MGRDVRGWRVHILCQWDCHQRTSQLGRFLARRGIHRSKSSRSFSGIGETRSQTRRRRNVSTRREKRRFRQRARLCRRIRRRVRRRGFKHRVDIAPFQSSWNDKKRRQKHRRRTRKARSSVLLQNRRENSQRLRREDVRANRRFLESRGKWRHSRPNGCAHGKLRRGAKIAEKMRRRRVVVGNVGDWRR